jgi:hypothetical protein
MGRVAFFASKCGRCPKCRTFCVSLVISDEDSLRRDRFVGLAIAFDIGEETFGRRVALLFRVIGDLSIAGVGLQLAKQGFEQRRY